MHLHSIKLTNFKNYETATLEFSEKINCFVGRNGMGKTNMLDAIYYLCMCKSNFGVNDRNLPLHTLDFFRLEGAFQKNNKKEQIVAKVIPGKKKEIERNQVPYKKLMEHIGLLPVVMIVPDDTLLVNEGSETRRRFLDNTLSQIDTEYLKALLLYNKVLKQRNAALKEFAINRYYNDDLIRTYNQQLIPPAQYIFDKRSKFIEDFDPLFNEYYRLISGGQEEVSLRYHSLLSKGPFKSLLAESANKDQILQRTTVGIHKDDIKLHIRGYGLKQFGSQGQLKSFVLAMKLGQYDLLKKEKKEDPILLLDDIFDKLDNDRVRRLIALLVEKEFGQIFITDTHEKRLEEIIELLNTDFKKFTVNFGKIE